MDCTQLADFLRRRRDDLHPEDVGLSRGPRRRAVGLRREEVAALAGMSTDYYIRLEQARGPQPSTQILSSLARALRLGIDERDHLFRLAGHGTPQRTPLDTHVAPALQRVLDRLDDTPALILSGLNETLMQNRLAVALLGDHSAHTGLSRSGVHRWFTDPAADRDLYPLADQPRQSRAQVAGLRTAYSVLGPDSRAGEIVTALQKESEEFRDLWARHEVATRFEDHKTLIHPEVGEIALDCQALFTEDQSQALLVLTAAPRTEAHEQLQMLAVVGRQHMATPSR